MVLKKGRGEGWVLPKWDILVKFPTVLMTIDNPNFYVSVTKLKMWLRITGNNPKGRGRARQWSCIFQGLICEITIADKMNILLLNISHVAFKSYWFPSLHLRRTNVTTPVAAKASPLLWASLCLRYVCGIGLGDTHKAVHTHTHRTYSIWLIIMVTKS